MESACFALYFAGWACWTSWFCVMQFLLLLAGQGVVAPSQCRVCKLIVLGISGVVSLTAREGACWELHSLSSLSFHLPLLCRAPRKRFNILRWVHALLIFEVKVINRTSFLLLRSLMTWVGVSTCSRFLLSYSVFSHKFRKLQSSYALFYLLPRSHTHSPQKTKFPVYINLRNKNCRSKLSTPSPSQMDTQYV